MEYLDVYDKHRKKKGYTKIRGERFLDGEYFLVVHLCLFKEEKLLIQKRAEDKNSWPGLWSFSVAGVSNEGEDSLDAIKREAFEEIGYTISLDIIPLLSVNFSKGFDDIYILKDEKELSEFRLQKEEVADIKYATKNEILSMMDEGKFVPYKRALIDLIFSMKDIEGAFDITY